MSVNSYLLFYHISLATVLRRLCFDQVPFTFFVKNQQVVGCTKNKNALVCIFKKIGFGCSRLENILGEFIFLYDGLLVEFEELPSSHSISFSSESKYSFN